MKLGVIITPAGARAFPMADSPEAARDAAALWDLLDPLLERFDRDVRQLLLEHGLLSDASDSNSFVDIIVEMRRFDPERREDTRRVLTAYSRFEETPAEMVLTFDREHGYSVVGTKAEARAGDRMNAAMGLFPDALPGETPEELLKRWPAEGVPKPGERTFRDDLNAAVERGTIHRTGGGVKNDPHRFYVPCPNAIPASPPPYTRTLQESNPELLEDASQEHPQDPPDLEGDGRRKYALTLAGTLGFPSITVGAFRVSGGETAWMKALTDATTDEAPR